MKPTAGAGPSNFNKNQNTSTSQPQEPSEDGLGPGKKRKIRHVRVKTGCRDCRMRRIKCPEGRLVAEGVKLPCEKCDETGTPCWYPAPDDLGRRATRWIRAAALDKDGNVISTVEGSMTIKQETGETSRAAVAPSASFASMTRDIMPQETLQPIIPLHQEIKQERPSTPIHYFPNQPAQLQLRQPPLPYYEIPEAPIAGPSNQGPSMFAESSLRNSNQISVMHPPQGHSFYQHPATTMHHSERAITLPRIPKGIGTYGNTAQLQWQSGPEVASYPPAPHNSPYVPAAPSTYEISAVPTSTFEVFDPSSRTPYMQPPSASISTTRQEGTYSQRTMLPPSHQDVNSGSQFRLHMTRIPWVKRRPMHVDHSRFLGGRNQASMDALVETGAAAVSPLVIADNLHRYLASVNSPVPPLRSFTLASMLTSPLERMAMEYFETRGCMEIIAAGEMKSNWIYAQVFPRVYDLLAEGTDRAADALLKRSRRSGTGVEIARMEARQLVKEYVHHSLIRLSCVHRANTEREPTRIEALRREVRAHEKRAMRAGLTARVHFPESVWKTEEYLMGTFIGYMADMLDSRTFQVDLALMALDPGRVCSGFETILRDMIAVYHTLLTAFLPHDPLVPVKERGGVLALSTLTYGGRADITNVAVGRGPRDSIAMGGIESTGTRPSSAPVLLATSRPNSAPIPSSSSAVGEIVLNSAPATIRRIPGGIDEDWVESFFGLARDMIVRIGEVNKMVARRAELLRDGTEEGDAGWTLRRAAERLVVQLGGGGGAGGGVVYGREDAGKARPSGAAFEAVEMAPGRSDRVRRGTSVIGLGLLILILCELLHADLEDPRLMQATERALEMVADSETSETAGLSWALTVSPRGKAVVGLREEEEQVSVK